MDVKRYITVKLFGIITACTFLFAPEKLHATDSSPISSTENHSLYKGVIKITIECDCADLTGKLLYQNLLHSVSENPQFEISPPSFGDIRLKLLTIDPNAGRVDAGVETVASIVLLVENKSEYQNKNFRSWLSYFVSNVVLTSSQKDVKSTALQIYAILLARTNELKSLEVR
jgi:hypothetical protein